LERTNFIVLKTIHNNTKTIKLVRFAEKS
jgi:hypothetical protein